MATVPVLQSPPGTSSTWTPRLLVASHRDRQALLLARRALFIWLILRTLLWSVVLAYQPNPGQAVIEAICHARAGSASPAGKIVETILRQTPGSSLLFHFSTQLILALALWGVFRIARVWRSPRSSLLLVLSCDFILSASLLGLGPLVGLFLACVFLAQAGRWSRRQLTRREWSLLGLGGVGVATGWFFHWKPAEIPALLFIIAYWCHLKTDDAGRTWKRSRFLWGVCSLAAAIVMLADSRLGLLSSPTHHLQGEQLAQEVCNRFREQYGNDPEAIVGDPWLAGIICYHAPNRPRRDHWQTQRDDPCVLIWNADQHGEDLPPAMRTRFTGARCIRGLEIACGGGHRMRIGWAMVAGKKNSE